MEIISVYKYGLRHSVNILLIYGMYLILAFVGLWLKISYVSCIAFLSCGIICAIYKLDWKYTHNYLGLLLIAKSEHNPKVMLEKFKGALSCHFKDNQYSISVTETREHSVEEDTAELYNFRSYVKATCRFTNLFYLVIVMSYGLMFIVACWTSLGSVLYWSFIISIVFIILDNLLTTYSLTEAILLRSDEFEE